MPKKQHTEAEIISALKQYESGEKTADICRKLGVSQATFYMWKKQYAGLGVQKPGDRRDVPGTFCDACENINSKNKLTVPCVVGQLCGASALARGLPSEFAHFEIELKGTLRCAILALLTES